MLARTETNEPDGLCDVGIFMSPKYMKWRGKDYSFFKIIQISLKNKRKRKEATYINRH